VGPCAHHRHQQQWKRHQAFELRFFLVTPFAPTHIYNQTTLRTEVFTQSSFYVQVFLHREACAQRNFCTQTPLHTEVFTQRMIFLHTDALYEEVFARINKGTQAFLHTEPLPQRNLCTEQFLHTDFLAPKKINTEKIVHTDCTRKNAPRLFCTQKLYPEQFVPSSNSSAQKPFRTDFLNAQQLLQTDGFYTESFPHRSLTHRRFLRTTVFYIQRLLYTDAFTGRRIAHRNLCVQHTFTCNQFLHREILFPLLDHLPFVFPLSSFVFFVVRSQILVAFFPFLPFFPSPSFVL